MEGGNDPSSLESEAQKESQEFRANQGVSVGRELLSHRKRQNCTQMMGSRAVQG